MNPDIKWLYKMFLDGDWVVVDMAYSIYGRIAIWPMPAVRDKEIDSEWYDEPVVLKPIR